MLPRDVGRRLHADWHQAVDASSPVHSANIQGKRALAARFFFLPPFAPPLRERRVRPRQAGSGLCVHAAFDLVDARKHGIERWHVAEDHPSHGGIVRPRSALPKKSRACVAQFAASVRLPTQQIVPFHPDAEHDFPCSGHEGTPAGRCKGNPCDNRFAVTLKVTRSATG